MAIPVPNFGALADQQGQVNQQAANQQTTANRPNQFNSWGSLTWQQNPDGTWNQFQTLDPNQQNLMNMATWGQNNLAGQVAGGVNANGLSDWGSSDITSGVPGMPDSGFGASQQVIDAMKGLQQPGLNQARDAERARLAAMGITLGSDASNNSERVLGGTQNDADLKAILAGTQEYGNVFNRGLAARQQGVSEKVQSSNLATALRGAQGNERINMNAANLASMAGLAGAKESTRPTFAGFSGATALPPSNQYGAAMDTYNAYLAQQNADRAASAGRTAGTASLVGQGIQGLGGIGGIAGLAGTAWNGVTNLLGGGAGSDTWWNNLGGGDSYDYLANQGGGDPLGDFGSGLGWW
jgi:hypothetical protein